MAKTEIPPIAIDLDGGTDIGAAIVDADLLEYFANTFAALPVGAISTERFPKIGKDFTREATMVVFPVPA